MTRFSFLYCAGLLFAHLIAANAAPRIVFHGHREFSSDELARFINVTDSTALDSAGLAACLQALQDSMIAQDFINARIDSAIWETDRKGRRALHVFLYEGNLARVSEVLWLGDSARVPLAVAARVLCRAGDAFRWSNVAYDADLIVTQMGNAGYPFARVDVDWIPDSLTAEVQIRYLISSGPVTKLNFIAFPGNKLTRASYLQRETRLRVGDLFDQRKIDAARRRLARLDFIRNAGRPEVAVNDAGETGVRFPVEEARSTRIDAVAGYLPAAEGRDAVISGLANLEFLNLFGTGRRGKIRWERPNQRVQSVDVSYREPWILGQPLALRLDFTQRVEDTLYVSRRIAARVEYELGTKTTVWGTLQYEAVFTDSASAVQLNLPDNRTTYTETGFAFDTRDHSTNPRSGVFFSTYAGTGWRHRDQSESGEPAGSFRHHRVGVDNEIAQAISAFWIADFSVHARVLESTEPEVLLPDLYRVGGARTVRGYREEQFFGSRVGWASAELRYWTGPASRIFAFCDAGSVYREQWLDALRYERSNDFFIGVGIGLRLETNMGVWGFDYGVGRDDKLLSGKIHVSLQSSF
jgi:outer membrane protein assembly factor BamA